MPFQYLLTNLLVDVPGAQGVIFVDPEGEFVDFVTSQATTYELKLEGAYHGIFMRRAGRLAQLVGGGELLRMVVAGSKLKVMSRRLRGGYYLVLVMAAHTPESLAGAAMRRTGDVLNREIP